MRARSAGRLYSWLDNVGARVRDGLHASRARRLDPNNLLAHRSQGAGRLPSKLALLRGATLGGARVIVGARVAVVRVGTVSTVGMIMMGTVGMRGWWNL